MILYPFPKFFTTYNLLSSCKFVSALTVILCSFGMTESGGVDRASHIQCQELFSITKIGIAVTFGSVTKHVQEGSSQRTQQYRGKASNDIIANNNIVCDTINIMFFENDLAPQQKPPMATEGVGTAATKLHVRQRTRLPWHVGECRVYHEWLTVSVDASHVVEP